MRSVVLVRIASTMAVAGCLAGLSACRTTTREYVDAAVGYSVTRCSVERLENFSSNGKEYLADGVALRVHLPGGKASVRLGQSRQDFELAAGSYLVYSKNGDYVLVPLADGDDVE